MHIQDIFEQHRTTFSFEFFPPGDSEASDKLFTNISELEALKPSFVSVTYGAGGAKRRLTQDLVARIKTETSCDPIPHLPTVCHKEPEVRDILERYAELGISNILALAGDPPGSMKDYDRSQDAFRYAADLVKYLKRFNESGSASRPAWVRDRSCRLSGGASGDPKSIEGDGLPQGQSRCRSRLHRDPALFR